MKRLFDVTPTNARKIERRRRLVADFLGNFDTMSRVPPDVEKIRNDRHQKCRSTMMPAFRRARNSLSADGNMAESHP